MESRSGARGWNVQLMTVWGTKKLLGPQQKCSTLDKELLFPFSGTTALWREVAERFFVDL